MSASLRDGNRLFRASPVKVPGFDFLYDFVIAPRSTTARVVFASSSVDESLSELSESLDVQSSRVEEGATFDKTARASFLLEPPATSVAIRLVDG